MYLTHNIGNASAFPIIKVVRSRLSSQFTFGSDCIVAYIQIATVRLSYTSEAAAIVFNTFCSITHREIRGEQGIETALKFIQDELLLALVDADKNRSRVYEVFSRASKLALLFADRSS